ncbi:calponin homology domain-containing protein [Mycena latifolia]|nr:calponin homology domain-containing protein [Mycena latifolia]
MAGASRAELLLWLNELLTQCDTGGAYCQIIDSIYPGDVPMARRNYKIFQPVFKAKKIDPVEGLVKCKMHIDVARDNLDFLQWLKKFWDANYSGEPYDAIARRKGAPADPPARSTNATAAGRAGGRTPLSGHRSITPGRAGAPNNARKLQALHGQVCELLAQLKGLISRRYLRDIEVLVPAKSEVAGKDDETLREIQSHTQEGFEVPAGLGEG